MNEIIGAFLSGAVVTFGILGMLRLLTPPPVETPVPDSYTPRPREDAALLVQRMLGGIGLRGPAAVHRDYDLDIRVEWIPERRLWKETVNGRYRLQRSIEDVRHSLIGRLSSPRVVRQPHLDEPVDKVSS